MTSAFATGSVIASRYELREVLGEGTLGACFKAQISDTGKSCVVKALPAKFAKKKPIVEKFTAHYTRLKARQSEDFALILDVGEHDGVPFVVIEFLEGLSLRQLLEARVEEGSQFSLSEAESIAEEVARILSWLHQSTFHGSVKPENIFLLPDRIKMTDDGLMDFLPPAEFASIQVGNPGAAPYCAPELLSNPDAAQREVDVFGLTAVLYELLANEPPALADATLTDFREDLSKGIDNVIRKGMADDPRSRYPTVTTFLLDLAKLENDQEKIEILQAIVEEEAAAEAERTMAELRQESIELEKSKPESADQGEAQQSESEADEAQRDVSHLFVDDDLPDTLPNMAIADNHQAEIDGDRQFATAEQEPGDDTDLLTPTPTISGSTASNRKPMIIAIVLLLLAGAGGGGYYFFGQPQQKAQPPKQNTDSQAAEDNKVNKKMEKMVSGAIADAQDIYDGIVDQDAALKKDSATNSALDLLEDAESALAERDYETGLQLARMAQGELQGVADRMEREQTEQREAREAEKAAASARSKASDPKPSTPTQRSQPAPKETKVAAAQPRSTCPDGMVKVPSGPFMAGSPPEDLLRDPTERSLDKIQVDTFCIDIYEYPNRKGARPKINLTQADAEATCAQEGKRLCSEVEWEKVCKGPRNNDFPYGKVWDPNVCNTETATGEDRSLAPLGGKSACKSDYGVFDLSGNVLEWTGSRFEQNKNLAIAKGGSYMRPDYAARCAYRYTAPAGTKDAEIGFRCCADL